jgi:hypothetical protein
MPARPLDALRVATPDRFVYALEAVSAGFQAGGFHDVARRSPGGPQSARDWRVAAPGPFEAAGPGVEPGFDVGLGQHEAVSPKWLELVVGKGPCEPRRRPAVHYFRQHSASEGESRRSGLAAGGLSVVLLGAGQPMHAPAYQVQLGSEDAPSSDKQPFGLPGSAGPVSEPPDRCGERGSGWHWLGFGTARAPVAAAVVTGIPRSWPRYSSTALFGGRSRRM